MNLRGFAFLLVVVLALSGAVVPFTGVVSAQSAPETAAADGDTSAGGSAGGVNESLPSVPTQSNAVCRADASAVVNSYQGLKRELQRAESGAVVLVEPGATIRMGQNHIDVPTGVTLAGGRGCSGSEGAHLVTNYRGDMQPLIDMTGARVTGVRITGPFMGLTDNTGSRSKIYDHARTAIKMDDGTVDHSVIKGWSWAAVKSRGQGQVISNRITDTRYQGLGYGVVVSPGKTVIEGNAFARNRHAVAGVGSRDLSYTVRNNYFGPGMISHVVDAHGTGDSSVSGKHQGGVAADRLVITNNTWASNERTAIKFRGSVVSGALIRGNTFPHAGKGAAFEQVGGNGNVRFVSNNYEASVQDTLEDAAAGAVSAVGGAVPDVGGGVVGDAQAAVKAIGRVVNDPIGWATEQLFMPFAESAGGLIDKFSGATVGITSSCDGDIGRECFVPDPNATPVWFLAWVFYYGSYATFGLAKLSVDSIIYIRADFSEQSDVLRQKLKENAALLLAWPALQIFYLVTGTFIEILIPDGRSFFLTPEAFSKLALGGFLAIVGLSVNATVSLAAVFFGWAMQELLKICTGLIILGLLVHRTRIKSLHYWGAVMLVTPLLIVSVRVMQAVGLWFAFYMPVGTLSAQSIKSVAIILFLLWVIFITTPRTARHSILPEAAMMASTRLEGKLETKEQELRSEVDGSDIAAYLSEQIENVRSDSTDSRTGESFDESDGSGYDGEDYDTGDSDGNSGETFDIDDEDEDEDDD